MWITKKSNPQSQKHNIIYCITKTKFFLVIRTFRFNVRVNLLYKNLLIVNINFLLLEDLLFYFIIKFLAAGILGKPGIR